MIHAHLGSPLSIWLFTRLPAQPGLRVAIVAAGERWPDGSLRPAVEDLWGAGAFIAYLHAAGWPGLSPEARAAAAAYSALADISNALADCASGRELIEIGHADDVHIAAQLAPATLSPSSVTARSPQYEQTSHEPLITAPTRPSSAGRAWAGGSPDQSVR